MPPEITTAAAAVILTDRGWRMRRNKPITAKAVRQWCRRRQLPARLEGSGPRATWYIEPAALEAFQRPKPGPKRSNMEPKTDKIEGAVTERKLAAWMERNRPNLVAHEVHGIKGFYAVETGIAHSFQSCGPKWRDVAAQLGAVDVPSDE